MHPSKLGFLIGILLLCGVELAAQRSLKVCQDSIVLLVAREFACPLGEKVEFITPAVPQQRIGLDSLRIQFSQTGQYQISCRCKNAGGAWTIEVSDCQTYPCLGPNLVPNPSFENYQTCDSVSTLTNKIAAWQDLTLTHGAITGSTDYFNSGCTRNSPLGLYRQIPQDNPPRSGKGMIGGFQFRFQAYTVIWDTTGRLRKEYAYVKLIKPMQAGKQYRVRFYAKFTYSRQFRNGSIDRLGAALSVDNPQMLFNSQVKPTIYIGSPPQVESPAGKLLRDTAFWIPVSKVIQADRAYQYLLLGHFHDLNETSIRNFFQGTNAYNAYYLFDDASVEEIKAPLPYRAVQIEKVCRLQDTATLVQNLGCDSILITKRVFSTSADTVQITGLTCVARDTGVFVQKLQKRNGCDSIVLRQIRWRPCPDFDDGEKTALFVPEAISPNGDGVNDAFQLFLKPDQNRKVLRLAIFDRWGSLVFEQKDFTPHAEEMIWRPDAQSIGPFTWLILLQRPNGKTELLRGAVQILR
jgi:CHU_C Type IX secretion signal domain